MSRISTLVKPVDSAGVSPFRRVPQWISETSLISLSLALFMGVASAQPASWPIVNGRRPQPTQQQIDSREGNTSRQSNRAVQSDVDRLYAEIMRASLPQGF
jgi:hypothetical protein